MSYKEFEKAFGSGFADDYDREHDPYSDETLVFTLPLEDGSDGEYIIMDEFEMDGNTYALLCAVIDDSIYENPEDFLFAEINRFGDEPEAVSFYDIESDEAYTQVAEYYFRLKGIE